MANLLKMHGQSVHKMYMQYEGSLRQVRYAYYNNRMVYSCFEPPVITGMRLKVLKTTLTNSESTGSTKTVYVYGYVTGGYYTFEIPACECTILDLELCWTQQGPDGECGTSSEFISIATAASYGKFTLEETPKYNNSWSIDQLLTYFENLYDTDNYYNQNLGINSSFSISINGESSSTYSILYFREINTIETYGYDSEEIYGPDLDSYSGYEPTTISVLGNTGYIKHNYPIYTSTYLETSDSTPIYPTIYVSQDGGTYTELTTNSYSITTSTYHDTTASHTYRFKAVYNYDGLEYTAISTYNQNSDYKYSSSYTYKIESYVVDPEADFTLGPLDKDVTLKEVYGTKITKESWRSGAYEYDEYTNKDILDECKFRSYGSGSNAEFTIDETGHVATYNTGSSPWLYIRWIYNPDTGSYKETDRIAYKYNANKTYE